MLVEQRGRPLSVAIEGASVHDTKLLAETIEAIVVERPDPDEVPQHLCLDKAYPTQPARPPAMRPATSLTFAGLATPFMPGCPQEAAHASVLAHHAAGKYAPPRDLRANAT